MPGAGSRRCRRPSARQDGSKPPIKHLIVAGAGGSIGRRLVETALADRRRVTARARDTASLPAGVRFGSWRLGEPLPRAGLNPDRPRRPKPLSIRHTLGARSDADDRNRSGTRLIGGARSLGLGRTVFGSSRAARRCIACLRSREGGDRAGLRCLHRTLPSGGARRRRTVKGDVRSALSHRAPAAPSDDCSSAGRHRRVSRRSEGAAPQIGPPSAPGEMARALRGSLVSRFLAAGRSARRRPPKPVASRFQEGARLRRSPRPSRKTHL